MCGRDTGFGGLWWLMGFGFCIGNWFGGFEVDSAGIVVFCACCCDLFVIVRFGCCNILLSDCGKCG